MLINQDTAEDWEEGVLELAQGYPGRQRYVNALSSQGHFQAAGLPETPKLGLGSAPSACD